MSDWPKTLSSTTLLNIFQGIGLLYTNQGQRLPSNLHTGSYLSRIEDNGWNKAKFPIDGNISIRHLEPVSNIRASAPS